MFISSYQIQFIAFFWSNIHEDSLNESDTLFIQSEPESSYAQYVSLRAGAGGVWRSRSGGGILKHNCTKEALWSGDGGVWGGCGCVHMLMWVQVCVVIVLRLCVATVCLFMGLLLLSSSLQKTNEHVEKLLFVWTKLRFLYFNHELQKVKAQNSKKIFVFYVTDLIVRLRIIFFHTVWISTWGSKISQNTSTVLLGSGVFPIEFLDPK